MLRNVVVTGAGGFVGQVTCATLLCARKSVHALARRPFPLSAGRPPDFRVTVVEDLATTGRLEELLAGADAVIHLAARVHRVSEEPAVAVDSYARDVQRRRAAAGVPEQH
jgi:uncharacterized protein YbjT (DUF2867 family)